MKHLSRHEVPVPVANGLPGRRARFLPENAGAGPEVSASGIVPSHDRPEGRYRLGRVPAPDRVLVGTSGYNYPEWRGSFYPEKLSTTGMLAFYAERFRTVEINYTFYRIPTEKLLAGWAAGTPDGFIFTLKAPRRITHDAKLQRCEDLLQTFCRTARTLGPKLGVLLFQLPPSFRKQADVLRAFVNLIPDGTRAAFEFRHASWLDGEVYDILRERELALCIADSEKLSTPVEATASYAYFRLRDEGYQDGDLQRWAATVRDLPGPETAYVYFKHEEQGLGPEFARRFSAHLT